MTTLPIARFGARKIANGTSGSRRARCRSANAANSAPLIARSPTVRSPTPAAFAVTIA